MKNSKIKPIKSEIKEKLDGISEMNQEEFKINYEYITKTAKEAYDLIRRMEITISKLNSNKKKDKNFKVGKDFKGV